MERYKLKYIQPGMRPKWPGKMLDEGFIPLPKRLLRVLDRFFDESEGMQELRVVLAIADFKRPHITGRPTAKLLAYVAGLSDHEFQQALSRLEGKQYVHVVHDVDGADFDHAGLCTQVVELTDTLDRQDRTTSKEESF